MNSLWRLPPLAGILDPRPESEAKSNPILDAANIPFDELPHRLAELPPRTDPILLADFRDKSSTEACLAAADFLQRGGRAIQWRGPVPACEFIQGRLWSPNPLLEAVAIHTPGKRALDLGCGSGRDAVTLASAGFDVLGIDILPEAIKSANALFGRLKGPGWGEFRGLCGDFDSAEAEFDLAISFLSFSAAVPAILRRSLAPGAIVAVEAFTVTDAEASGKPIREHHVASCALPELFPEFEVLLTEAVWRSDRHLERFVGRRGK